MYRALLSRDAGNKGTAWKNPTPFLEHMLPPNVGVSALHPRTSGEISLAF
jgi:hypothetical protein